MRVRAIRAERSFVDIRIEYARVFMVIHYASRMFNPTASVIGADDFLGSRDPRACSAFAIAEVLQK